MFAARTSSITSPSSRPVSASTVLHPNFCRFPSPFLPSLEDSILLVEVTWPTQKKRKLLDFGTLEKIGAGKEEDEQLSKRCCDISNRDRRLFRSTQTLKHTSLRSAINAHINDGFITTLQHFLQPRSLSLSRKSTFTLSALGIFPVVFSQFLVLLLDQPFHPHQTACPPA